MTKKTWMVAFVAFVFMNVWGFAIYAGVLASYIKEAMEGVGRPEGLMWPYFVRAALIAIILAVMYPKGYEGKTPWREGLNFGLLTAVLLVSYSGFDLYASFPFSLGTLVVMYIPEFVGYCILGVVIGALYGKPVGES